MVADFPFETGASGLLLKTAAAVVHFESDAFAASVVAAVIDTPVAVVVLIVDPVETVVVAAAVAVIALHVELIDLNFENLMKVVVVEEEVEKEEAVVVIVV